MKRWRYILIAHPLGKRFWETPTVLSAYWRMTQRVSFFLITIGWFVNIAHLWFNLLCAVRWKLFSEGFKRGLLIYLQCVNSVLVGERTLTFFSPKQAGETLTCVDPKPWDRLHSMTSKGDQRATLSFLWPPACTHSPPHSQLLPFVLLCAYTARSLIYSRYTAISAQRPLMSGWCPIGQ